MIDNNILNKIIHDIEKQRLQKHNIIVAVCGGSCTRKSSLISAILIDYFQGECVLISQDQFQHQPAYVDNMHPVYKRDHPDNFGIKACFEALVKLKQNQTVEIPNYTFKKEEPITYISINPKPIIIFEGMYTHYKQLQNLNDISIYTYSSWYARMVRRLYRNTLDRYKNKDEYAVLESFSYSVTRAHMDYVSTQKTMADYKLHIPLDFQQLIHHYHLKPLPCDHLNTHILFSFRNKVAIDIIEKENKIPQFKLYFQNNLYADFAVTPHLVERLKQINWKSI